MEQVWRFLLLDVPEPFIALMVGLSLFNRSIFPKWRQGFILSFVYSGILFFIDQFAFEIKVPIAFCLMIALVFFLLKESIWMSLFITAGAFTIMMATELVALFVLQSLSITLPDILETTHYLLVGRWTHYFIVLALVYLNRKNRFDLRNLIPSTKLNRYLFILMVVGSIEFVTMAIVTSSSYVAYQYPFMSSLTEYTGIYLNAVLIFYLLMILLFAKYLVLSMRHVQTETATPFMKNLDEMLAALHNMREENNKGFQTLLALMEAGEVEEALKFTKQVNAGRETDIKKIEGVRNPAVASLLSAKAAICLAHRIRFSVEVDSETQFHFMKTFEIVQLFGNLLDNAIRAALDEQGGRYVCLRWSEDDKEEVLMVENNGRTIPPDKLSQIFELGYTTKNTGEGGVGLAIVKRVVNRYKGRIDVDSSNGITRFQISFQK